jgi:predicted dehydrogenase
MRNIKLLVVGCGLIGKKRLLASIRNGIPVENLFVYDSNLDLLKFRSQDEFKNITILVNIESLTEYNITHAIVAVPHNESVSIVSDLLTQQIIVLMEKPVARNLLEAERLFTHPKSKNLSIGFNYRFMPGLQILRKALVNKDLGKISSIKLELGHGGSPRDKETWKLDPIRAGGGVLLDPGIHLIDLLVFLFEGLDKNIEIRGVTKWKGFWNTGIEESMNIIGYVKEIPFNITCSIVAWRTRFNVEVIGTEGYIEVSGRGRTDGPHTYKQGHRWGWMNGGSQRNSEVNKVLSSEDLSLEIETAAWINKEPSVCSISSAYEGMKIYDQIKEQELK